MDNLHAGTSPLTGGNRPSPRDGDVVIAPDPRDASLYTLSVVPGTPQVRYPSYEKALSVAVQWAAKTRVTLWTSEDGRTFTALKLEEEA